MELKRKMRSTLSTNGFHGVAGISSQQVNCTMHPPVSNGNSIMVALWVALSLSSFAFCFIIRKMFEIGTNDSFQTIRRIRIVSFYPKKMAPYSLYNCDSIADARQLTLINHSSVFFLFILNSASVFVV